MENDKSTNAFPTVIASDTAVVSSVQPGKTYDVYWDPGFLYNQEFPSAELVDSAAESSGNIDIDFAGQISTGESMPVHVLCLEISTNQQSSAETNINVSVSAPCPDAAAGVLTNTFKVKIPKAGDTGILFLTFAERQGETQNVVHKRVLPTEATGLRLQISISGLVPSGQSSVSAFSVFPGSSRWAAYIDMLKTANRGKC